MLNSIWPIWPNSIVSDIASVWLFWVWTARNEQVASTNRHGLWGSGHYSLGFQDRLSIPKSWLCNPAPTHISCSTWQKCVKWLTDYGFVLDPLEIHFWCQSQLRHFLEWITLGSRNLCNRVGLVMILHIHTTHFHFLPVKWQQQQWTMEYKSK